MRTLTQSEHFAADQILALLKGLPRESANSILAHVSDQLQPRVDEDDQPYYSRGIAGPLGKLEHELKTKVDEQTHLLFRQQCAMQNTDTARELRNCVYALVHGKSYDQMLVERLNHDVQRTRALAQLIGPFGGPESGGHHG